MFSSKESCECRSCVTTAEFLQLMFSVALFKLASRLIDSMSEALIIPVPVLAFALGLTSNWRRMIGDNFSVNKRLAFTEV